MPAARATAGVARFLGTAARRVRQRGTQPAPTRGQRVLPERQRRAVDRSRQVERQLRDLVPARGGADRPLGSRPYQERGGRERGPAPDPPRFVQLVETGGQGQVARSEERRV